MKLRDIIKLIKVCPDDIIGINIENDTFSYGFNMVDIIPDFLLDKEVVSISLYCYSCLGITITVRWRYSLISITI